jgi:hypothetical protein
VANPWDIPALPSLGEMSTETIFTAVGRALSQWEYFEGYLGEVYCYLIGSPSQTSPAMRSYGSVTVNSTRTEMIKSAANAYFITNNIPQLTELNAMLNKARNFSARRNDIAHGIVQPFAQPNGLAPQTFALVPSRHATKRKRLEFNLVDNKFDTVYEYAYTSKEINYFRDCFDGLANEAIKVWTGLIMQ